MRDDDVAQRTPYDNNSLLTTAETTACLFGVRLKFCVLLPSEVHLHLRLDSDHVFGKTSRVSKAFFGSIVAWMQSHPYKLSVFRHRRCPAA